VIGNDIVDLNQAKIESDWERPRFLDKIFTSEERRIILKAENPFQMVWRLWSMKESAYKIYARKHKIRSFIPQKLNCKLEGKRGVVLIEKETFYTHSLIESNLVYTLAKTSKNEAINKNVLEFFTGTIVEQRKAIHQGIIKSIAESYNYPLEAIHLKRNSNGAPVIYVNDNESPLCCTTTHHGNYIAYSIQ